MMKKKKVVSISKSEPQILPPIEKKIFEGSVKYRPPSKKLSTDFVKLLKDSKFKGLWIFASKELYQKWMAVHSHTLVLEYNGTYNIPHRKWYFPHGATLDLQIMTKDEDFSKLKGMRFSYVEVDGKIDPEIQEKAIEVIAQMVRKK